MIEESQAPKPAPAARNRWLDLVVPVAAVVISVVSLAVGIQQGRVQEKMLAAGSWPILVAESSNTDASGEARVITMTVRNDGSGPALLRWIEVRYDGQPVTGYADLIRRCCLSAAPTAEISAVSSQLSHSVLAAQTSRDFLVMPRTEANSPVWERLNAERFKITFDACYCSVVGECWRSALDGGEPKRTKSCPRDGGYLE